MCTLAVVVDGRLEDPKFESNLGYIAIACLNTILEKETRGEKGEGAEEEKE